VTGLRRIVVRGAADPRLNDVREPVTTVARTPRQIRTTLRLELLTAKTEQDRAVLRCALNLLRGVESFEIDPVTGVAHTVAGFEQAAASWASHYAEYDTREDGCFWQHDIVRDGRAVQARYAAVHPELAVPVWFPDHGPAVCAFCLMGANEAAGLPVDSGLDLLIGGGTEPKPTVPVMVSLPGLEIAA
jgi:hypothetical protein